MHRLDRRTIILRDKRKGTFDTDQYWLEQARRARVARRVRARLRRMQPVVLLTPRWSAARRFLDDMGTDLLIGTPQVTSRTLDCSPLKGLTKDQAWAWLVSALTELSGVRMEGPAWQAVSRHGYRNVMTQMFNAIQEGKDRRCLMLHAIEYVPFEALDDLVSVFEVYRGALDEDPRFNLLLGGTVATDQITIDGAGPAVVLQDFTHSEAIQALVEDLGPLEEHRLAAVVEIVGGIPQVLEALADRGESRLSELVADPDGLWNILGPLSAEIRHAFDIVHSDDGLYDRLERLARDGPLPEDVTLDRQLVLAGVANRTAMRDGRRIQVRAPAFAEYVLAS